MLFKASERSVSTNTCLNRNHLISAFIKSFCLENQSSDPTNLAMASLRESEQSHVAGVPTSEHAVSDSRTTRLIVPSVAAAVIQAICVFSMAANSVKVALGIGSVAAAGSSSFIHSTAIRIPLMIMAAVGATVTLYVVCNGWRLRNRPSARWRKQQVSKRERRRIGMAVAFSLLSWSLVIAEIFAHRVLHPR